MNVFHGHVTKSLHVFRLRFFMGTFLAYAEKSIMMALSSLLDGKGVRIGFDTIVFSSVVNSDIVGFQIKLPFEDKRNWCNIDYKRVQDQTVVREHTRCMEL